MSIIPLLCSFLFAPHLEWRIKTGADKKSYAVCIFANFCSTLVYGSNFPQFGSTFWWNAQKKEGKS